jgi:hypothetical protein
MRRLLPIVVPVFAIALVPAGAAEDAGFKPMFNGRDLTGWVNVNCHPSTFFAKGDEVITTGKPTGYLRTTKQYENFIAEFDWMHIPPKPGAVGNSGFFVWADPIPAVGTGYTRGIEVQVLVNLEKKDSYTSQGDLFSIWGAHCTPDRPHPQGWERCLPSENRCKGDNEWNHYRVEANDGVIKLHVNGKEVSGVSKCKPRKGYLALESEGSECHFRNLKIKELPSTNPKPEEIGDEDKGFVSLFNGLDLYGWKTDEGSWKVNDGHLKATGNSDLVTVKAFGQFELLFDYKGQGWTVKQLSGAGDRFVMNYGEDNPGKWHRVVMTVGKNSVSYAVDGKTGSKLGLDALPGPGPIKLIPTEGQELMNIFVRELK